MDSYTFSKHLATRCGVHRFYLSITFSIGLFLFIRLVNSNDVYELTKDTRFPVTIFNNGEVLFVPAGKIKTRCDIFLVNYPWDQQRCLIRFESWMYPINRVRIVGLGAVLEHSHFVENPQWHVRNTSSKNLIVKYQNSAFSRVDFFIIVDRKALFQITFTIFPCLALSLLQVFSHMLPFYDSERIKFGTTALMSFAIFHISIVEQVT